MSLNIKQNFGKLQSQPVVAGLHWLSKDNARKNKARQLAGPGACCQELNRVIAHRHQRGVTAGRCGVDGDGFFRDQAVQQTLIGWRGDQW